MKDTHKKELDELLKIPHEQRSIEQRVRVCELGIAKICDRLDDFETWQRRNGPAINAAWMNVPIGGDT
jgi:hypothetical protein